MISPGNIRILFRFLLNVPKAPAFWTTLTFWILNISMAVTAWTDHHTIFFWIKIFVPDWSFTSIFGISFCHLCSLSGRLSLKPSFISPLDCKSHKNQFSPILNRRLARSTCFFSSKGRWYNGLSGHPQPGVGSEIPRVGAMTKKAFRLEAYCFKPADWWSLWRKRESASPCHNRGGQNTPYNR